MVRKIILTLGAAAAIGAAALAPTAASAFVPKPFPHPHGPHFGHFGHFGLGFHGAGYVGGDDCYLVRRVVITPFGPRLRRVAVCD